MRTTPVQHQGAPRFLVAVIFLVVTATLLAAADDEEHVVNGTVFGSSFRPESLTANKQDTVVVRTLDLPFRIFETYSGYSCELQANGYRFLVNKSHPAKISLRNYRTIYFYGENATLCKEGFQFKIEVVGETSDLFGSFSITGVIVASLFACIGGSLIVAAFLVVMHRITNRRLMTVFHRYRVDPEDVDPEDAAETTAAKNRPRSNSNRFVVTQQTARNEKAKVVQNRTDAS